MPRLASLNAPWILHHVMGRGIEQKASSYQYQSGLIENRFLLQSIFSKYHLFTMVRHPYPVILI